MMLKQDILKIFLILLMFNLSCTNQTSCINPTVEPIKQEKVIIKHDDGRNIPHTTFAYIESTVYFKDKKCKKSCLIKNDVSTGSGFFIFRSSVFSNIGFVMTAKHLCDHMDKEFGLDKKLLHSFVVYDYFGRRHMADHYYSDDTSDVCVLIINDMQDDIPYVMIADSQTQIGAKAYTISAPKSFYNPRAALIFEGLYSGDIKDNRSLFTIPTEHGSSGSAIFDSDGKLIGMIIQYPLQNREDKSVRITPILCISESLDAIRRVIYLIATTDSIIKSMATKTSTMSQSITK